MIWQSNLSIFIGYNGIMDEGQEVEPPLYLSLLKEVVLFNKVLWSALIHVMDRHLSVLSAAKTVHLEH